MKNGNVSEFIDGLHYGYEMLFIYGGKKYFVQGWTENNINYLVLDMPEEKNSDYIWQCEAPTMFECAEKFLEAKLWDNRNFYEAENEMEWTDW